MNVASYPIRSTWAVLAALTSAAPACSPEQPARVSRFNEYAGYSEQRYDGWERTSVYVTVRDGTRIALDFFRPTANGELHEEPLPVIWTHTRYQRANLGGGTLNTMLDYLPPLVSLLRHGYVVGVADVRGSGASFGTKFGWFPPEEATDAYDITEWLASQPWSDGNIGMYGLSYLGITQYFAASEAPPHLKAIFPKMAFLDPYSFTYPGGIFLDWVIFSWGTGVQRSDLNASLPPNWQAIVEADRTRAAVSRTEMCPSVPCVAMGGQPGAPVAPVDEDADGLLLALATEEHVASPNIFDLAKGVSYRDSRHAGRDTPFHVERSLYPRLEAIGASGVAAYHVGGWFDAFPRETALWFRNYPGPQKMVIGPWFHNDITHYDEAAEELRWFDYWLKGIDNGVMDEDPIHYWTLGAPEGTEWRSAAEWPLPNEERVDFYFREGPTGAISSTNDGGLSETPPDGAGGRDDYTVDYTASAGPDNRWTWTAGGSAGGEPYVDMQDNDGKGMTYTTDVLDADLEVTGHPVVHLWVTSTAEDGDFFVYLEEVLPDSRSVMITEGALRASHRKLGSAPYDNMGLPWHPSGARDIESLIPGEPTELVLDLLPTSVLFHAGSRIRVTITGADKDTFETPVLSPPPTVVVLRDAAHSSRITLPVIPR